MIVLDNEVLEVLTGVGTFTVQTSSLHFVTINELKKVYARRFVNFYFLLGSSIPCPLSHKAMFLGRWDECIICP